MQQGWFVEYLGLRGADVPREKGRKYKSSGLEAKVHYRYPGKVSIRSVNWLLRRLDDLLGCLLTILTMSAKKYQHRVDAVILYSTNRIISRFWISFLHFLNIPVILEVCEWPLAIAEVEGTGYKDAEQFCRIIVPMADAVLPISSYIENEISKIARAKERILPSFKIPILIDVQSGNLAKCKAETNKYMLYSGMIDYIDIAMIVVDIVCALRDKNIHLPVKFSGKMNKIYFAKFKSYAENRGVFGYFDFTGFIEEKELHRLMCQATCLLAPSTGKLPVRIKISHQNWILSGKWSPGCYQ